MANGNVNWITGGKYYQCERIEGVCPKCGATSTIVALPAPLRAAQPDDTTHVCFVGLGGCNHGFAVDGAVAPEGKPLPESVRKLDGMTFRVKAARNG